MSMAPTLTTRASLSDARKGEIWLRITGETSSDRVANRIDQYRGT